ncbi:MAG: type I-C CRISPR-associated protein Cas5c [Lentisphaeria bacterium]|jgi:CRISPR-associated protein Cas5d|nr:type I-C CRISPR-associated protein Cas5c [Lentisphaeria bacterium]
MVENKARKNFCLRVWGDYAAFNRPELKVERVSYDIITPSAARAIFSAVFWKPAILWHVSKIEVLKPIKFCSLRRNEVAALASPKSQPVSIEERRQQRAALCLKDVAYRLYADMEYLPPEKRSSFNPNVEGPESPGKYFSMFERRAGKGQCFFTPYLGCREFSASFAFINDDMLAEDTLSHPALGPEHDRDFGIMLYDMDFAADLNSPPAMFFRAKMENGVVEVPSIDSKELLR